MLKLVIKRSKWLRGDDSESYLLRESDNKMCCLGFLARKCGLAPKEIRGHMTPEDTYSTKFPTSIVDKSTANTRTCGTLMTINDDPDLTDAERERKLTALFKRIKIGVRFVK